MLLERLRLRQVGPFDLVEFPFVDGDGAVRPVTVIHGDGGTGKSTLIRAIENTRPGHCSRTAIPRNAPPNSAVMAGWRLGDEDEERPHPLWTTTPGQSMYEDEEEERLRRREQSLFDKLAGGGRGFVTVEFSEHRSFPRAGLSISDPARSLLKLDNRSPGFSDRSRYELTRRCKQILAYAELSAALLGEQNVVTDLMAADSEDPAGFDPMAEDFGLPGLGEEEVGPTAADAVELDPRALREALHAGLGPLLALVGHRYQGLDPLSFEPLFETADGRLLHFDEMAKQARHLASFAIVGAHTLWAGTGGRDPREAEGVLLVDEIEMHLQPRVAAGVVDALRGAFPRAQWILTTASPLVAASVDPRELMAVRRLPGQSSVELYAQKLAQTH